MVCNSPAERAQQGLLVQGGMVVLSKPKLKALQGMKSPRCTYAGCTYPTIPLTSGQQLK